MKELVNKGDGLPWPQAQSQLLGTAAYICRNWANPPPASPGLPPSEELGSIAWAGRSLSRHDAASWAALGPQLAPLDGAALKSWVDLAPARLQGQVARVAGQQ